MKRFLRWYWFHIKRALWNRREKEDGEWAHLWSYVIINFVLQGLVLSLAVVAAIIILILHWMGL